MAETVFLILKIIGIILAVILGILLVGLLGAVFLPVKYRGSFIVEDEPEKKMTALLKASCLLHLVRAVFTYEKEKRLFVKVLFFTVYDTGREKKPSEKKPPKEKKDKKTKDTDVTEEDGEENEAETRKVDSAKAEEHNRPKESPGEKEETEESKKTKKKRGLKERISDILYTIRDFCDKLKALKEKAGSYKELWQAEHTVRSRELLLRMLLYLAKHTKPDKLSGYLKFGFEDPSSTGYGMALYGILYPLWGSVLMVEPDFEHQVLQCDIRMKGKMKLFHFLVAAGKLWFSKDVKKVMRDFKAIEK